jgi:hypothetical protein
MISYQLEKEELHIENFSPIFSLKMFEIQTQEDIYTLDYIYQYKIDK